MLSQLGWNSFFSNQVSQKLLDSYSIGRIIIEERNLYTIATPAGNIRGQVSNRIIKQAATPADFPKVGDWVLYTQYNESSNAVIYQTLERKTKVSRKAINPTPGTINTQEQIIATNIDLIFIVQAADQNFNLKRLDRYVAMVLSIQTEPIILINKTDVNPSWQALIEKVHARFPDIAVIGSSITTGQGIEAIKSYIKPGITASFIGSSGVGKSSLINALLESNAIKTKEISEKLGKGRHTTTHRELLFIPDGGAVIDTPGMRELEPWDAEEGIAQVFDDVTSLANECKFRDCTHTVEPGCAILKALDNGSLDYERYEQFIKLKSEQTRTKSHIRTGVQLSRKKLKMKDEFLT